MSDGGAGPRSLNMKVIKIKTCEDCPWIGGPDYIKEKGLFMSHCLETGEILKGCDIKNGIFPESCPLEDLFLE